MKEKEKKFHEEHKHDDHNHNDGHKHCDCHHEHDKCKCEKEHEHKCNCHHEGPKPHEKECKCHHDEKHHKDLKPHEEIEKLNKIIEEKDKKLLEAKAELINYGKRKDLEVSNMLKFASEDMIKELLQVVDNFERAIKLDDDNLEDELSKFLSGFKMIYCNLVKILENNGVKAIDGANKPFDPTYHEAVLTEAREGIEEGIVLEVLQKGYLYKGKVIRPAMVKVSE